MSSKYFFINKVQNAVRNTDNNKRNDFPSQKWKYSSEKYMKVHSIRVSHHYKIQISFVIDYICKWPTSDLEMTAAPKCAVPHIAAQLTNASSKGSEWSFNKESITVKALWDAKSLTAIRARSLVSSPASKTSNLACNFVTRIVDWPEKKKIQKRKKRYVKKNQCCQLQLAMKNSW